MGDVSLNFWCAGIFGAFYILCHTVVIGGSLLYFILYSKEVIPDGVWVKNQILHWKE